jgi:hypothetical protein
LELQVAGTLLSLKVELY